ncbi:hypothetical protein PFISCL1PPCAC_3220, partial [Pristionchus fissidentatus]
VKLQRMRSRRSAPVDSLSAHKNAIDRLSSSHRVVEALIDSAVEENAGKVLALRYEDSRVLKLYSCEQRCRYCAIAKCGVSVWHENHSSTRKSHRFLAPFNWIDDPADALLSSMIDVLRKLTSVPPLLILSLPRGSYGSQTPFVRALAFVLEQLPIRQMHVFLSTRGDDDDNYHFTALQRGVEEDACRTVQEVAALPLVDANTWTTTAAMPIYKFVDIACSVPANPIDAPANCFVLARNDAGAVTYRTSAFLPPEMWDECALDVPRALIEEWEERQQGEHGEDPVTDDPPQEESTVERRAVTCPLFITNSHPSGRMEEGGEERRMEGGREGGEEGRVEAIPDAVAELVTTVKQEIKEEPVDEVQEDTRMDTTENSQQSRMDDQPGAGAQPDDLPSITLHNACPLRPARRSGSSDPAVPVRPAGTTGLIGSIDSLGPTGPTGTAGSTSNDQQPRGVYVLDANGNRTMGSLAPLDRTPTSWKKTRGKRGKKGMETAEEPKQSPEPAAAAATVSAAGRKRGRPFGNKKKDEREKEATEKIPRGRKSGQEKKTVTNATPAGRKSIAKKRKASEEETKEEQTPAGRGRAVRGPRAAGGGEMKGGDGEEEDEERMEEERDDEEEGGQPVQNPYGAVDVFQTRRHGAEQRRAIAAKIRPTSPDNIMIGEIDRVIKELERNGDATGALVTQWMMVEQIVAPANNASLLEVLDEIASKYAMIRLQHPVMDPCVFFHD